MSTVFVNMTMSIDGCVVPASRLDDPERKQFFAQWGELQDYILRQKFFRERLKFGEGGETGADNDHLERTMGRTGVSIMGKRMFDMGELMWPEEAPFWTPVMVVTKTVRAPWARPGGTTFYFCNESIERVLGRARELAGTKDIRIAGGPDLVQQYLHAGLVDELELAIAPVILGSGVRLFDRIDASRLKLEQLPAIASPHVTHVRYAVRRR